ncbi:MULTISPECIES: GNAT family N-acetyltransferase [Vibrio]|uniref:GCN5 family acetyltransferase n=1 Tax=Vibrio bivalvicida TaxID=1276888 RepID=A0A177Y229_9VIBR|nr:MULTISPECIES: GNAT family N-acetyltransferase [Vibrio]KLN64985.1 GCN5 family acetyltransferase [Vibrio sp. VPAP30]OAJ94929.1 GCN5 family acetyltransferase [Vibrio bivalvicida]
MKCSLQKIDKSNYMQVCHLQVSQEQEHFLAPNTLSLVEAAFNEGYITRAIYAGDTLVGFLMWVHETETKSSIWRFMIAAEYQAQGFGRAALNLALDEMKLRQGVREIEIRYNPSNPVAKDFYNTFGFVETGIDIEHDDMLAVIELDSRQVA